MNKAAMPGARGSGDSCDPHAAADFLRALAHPARLQILCRLLHGEVSVAGMEAELGLCQPSLSQQLAQLRAVGLVTTRRQAKSVFYSLADDRVRPVIATLSGVFRMRQRDPATPPANDTCPVDLSRCMMWPALAGSGCSVSATAGWGLHPCKEDA
ncbi:MAG TPA: metalloregulator ArsR/SmtB family transcription factor [Rhodopila sp.]|nr:metalloregulator ArsR/SmtB family transcription factor [Rhodopila sp.]